MTRLPVEKLVQRARALAYITIIYNLLEAAACAWFGLQAEALSLLGFGSDSLLEASAATVVLWRMKGEDFSYDSRHADEGFAGKLIGGLFLLFALALTIGAIAKLVLGGEAQSGLPGIVISSLSLACMLGLYKAKRAVAEVLDSRALRADAFATLSCMWMSGLLLAGSLLIEGRFLPVFDAVTTLAIAALVAREGWEEIHEEDVS